MQNIESKYRPDIDGLRAIAVLLVLAFHLFVPGFFGGFVGVDIFFVISGYLITGIMAKEMEASNFSIARFYERRIRRIFPALIVVLLVCTVLSLRYLLPSELIAYGKSLLSACFSYSNFYFWSTADYFDAPAHTKPLLHTWSLAVEEQFYLCLPLLLIFLYRRKEKFRKQAILVLFVASFVCSAVLAFRDPNSAFYTPFSRAWELLTGSILALKLVPDMKSRFARESAAIVGLGAIVFATVVFSSVTPFPGVAALLPCVGSALLIAAGKTGNSTVGRVLSLSPVVLIGRISYSVYLWHWPLIVFTKMGFLPWVPRRFSQYAISITALSLLMGFLSWRFVETPFRVTRREVRTPRAKVFAATAIAMASTAAIALSFLLLSGLPSRFPASAIKLAESMDAPQEMRVGTCFITTKYRFDQFQPDRCMKVDPDKKNYLLLGDSHSAALWFGLDKMMANANILQASVAGCNPVLNVSPATNCGQMMRYVFTEFLPTHTVQGVFLTARWSSEKEFDRISETVGWFNQHNIPVYILGPVLEYDSPLPKLLAYSIAFNDSSLPSRHMVKGFLTLDKTMKREAASRWKVHYASIIDVECSSSQCIQFADSANAQPLMGDDNHLTNAGSLLVIHKLQAAGDLPS